MLKKKLEIYSLPEELKKSESVFPIPTITVDSLHLWIDASFQQF
jgi:hypothetical protein